jgi:hypothetical protein
MISEKEGGRADPTDRHREDPPGISLRWREAEAPVGIFAKTIGAGDHPIRGGSRRIRTARATGSAPIILEDLGAPAPAAGKL